VARSKAKTPEKPEGAELTRLAAQVVPETLDAEKRTVEVLFYSGAKILRNSWTDGPYQLSFSTDPAHVRLKRVNDGAPLLDSHADYSLSNILGVVEKAWLDNGAAKARKREDVSPIWQDVQDGIIQNISMGTVIHRTEDITPAKAKMKELLAVDWEPWEISLVPIGADPGAGVLAAEPVSEELPAPSPSKTFCVEQLALRRRLNDTYRRSASPC